MSEYTPDDYDMRKIYLAYSLDFNDDRRPGEDYGDMVRRCEGEFDRWLAQHEEAVRAAERERVEKILESQRFYWSKRFDESDGYESNVGSRYGGAILALDNTMGLVAMIKAGAE